MSDAPNLLQPREITQVTPLPPYLRENPIIIGLAYVTIKILALFCTHSNYEILTATNSAGELIHKRHVCRDCGKHVIKIAI